jgi:hypothetical protein
LALCQTDPQGPWGVRCKPNEAGTSCIRCLRDMYDTGVKNYQASKECQ